MIPRRRNGTVYTGRVGAKMRVGKPRRKPVFKSPFVVMDGPLRGVVLWLSSGSTLPVVVRGKAGQYAAKPGYARLQWQPL